MEFKKVIKCLDDTYVEGTAEQLADIAYRYNQDFSDENLEEIYDFAIAQNSDLKTNKPANIIRWMLESRREIAAGKMDLGQMKIDIYNQNTVTIPENTDELEIWREQDNVVLSMKGSDDNGFWTASSCVPVPDFLNLEAGSLESILGEIKAYNTIYEE